MAMKRISLLAPVGALILLAHCGAARAGAGFQVYNVPTSSTAARLDPVVEITGMATAVAGSAPQVSVVTQADLSGIASEAPTLFCVSGRPLEALKKQGLIPLLLGERAGHTGMQLVLLASEGSTAGALAGKRLATRALSADTRAVLDSHLFVPAGISLQSLKIVEVSKGLDALLALKSGQVEIALIDRLELDQAARVIQTAVKGLTELKVSPELPYAAVLAPARWATDPTILQVTGRLAQRTGDALGGIDRWVQVMNE